MNAQDISIELHEILWRYCNRTSAEYFEIMHSIERIARTRGIISTPMQAAGFAIIARDVLRIWEAS